MVQANAEYNNLFTVEERKKIIAQSMGELRKSSGLSQKEAAAKIGISQATYSAYERGRNEPPAEILVRLSHLYKCPVDILVQRDRHYRDAKDILKQAIKEFNGTVIVVSHDREFLDGLVEKVYEFGDGRVREHLCGINEFLENKRLANLQDIERK